jgi:hypothetical protein
MTFQRKDQRIRVLDDRSCVNTKCLLEGENEVGVSTSSSALCFLCLLTSSRTPPSRIWNDRNDRNDRNDKAA